MLLPLLDFSLQAGIIRTIMLSGIGLDIVNVKRIKKAISHLGERFLKRVFHRQEINRCQKKKNNKYLYYALSFATKEALLKANGSGLIKGLRLSEIEVIFPTLKRPQIKLHGQTKNKLKFKKIFASSSYAGRYAVAQVILEK